MSFKSIRIVLLTLLSAVSVLTAADSIFAQGKLGRVRDSVRSGDNASGNSHSHSGSHTESDNDDHDHDEPRRRRRRNRRGHAHNHHYLAASVAHFPAVDCYDHYYAAPAIEVYPTSVVQHVPVPATIVATEQVFVPETSQGQAYPEPVLLVERDWVGRLSLFAGSDFDDISQGTFSFLFQAPGSLGLDSSVTMFREHGTRFRDHLFVGDLNLVKEVYSNNLRARMGVGLNCLGDQYGGEAGLNLTAGFDWELTRRLLLTGEVDFGSIGDTDLFHYQMALGTRVGDNGNTEIIVGWDHHDIGGTVLNGGFVGMRIRF